MCVGFYNVCFKCTQRDMTMMCRVCGIEPGCQAQEKNGTYKFIELLFKLSHCWRLCCCCSVKPTVAAVIRVGSKSEWVGCSLANNQ